MRFLSATAFLLALGAGTGGAPRPEGDLHFNAGEYDSAIHSYRASLAAREVSEDSEAAAVLRHQLGFACLAAGRETEALGYFEENLSYHRARGDSASLSHYLLYTARILAARGLRGEGEAAIRNFEECRSLSRSDAGRCAEIDHTLVTLHEKTGDLPAARKVLRRARATLPKESWSETLEEDWARLSPGQVSPLFALGALLVLLLFFVAYLARRGGIHRLGARLLLAFLATLLALAVVEGALRYFAPPPPPRHYLHPPNQALRFRLIEAVYPGAGGRETKFTTNEAGVRGDPLPPTGVLRILAVGGSSTECLYLDDDEAWPQLLQESLARDIGRKVWVGNAGKSGLNTFGHRAQIFIAAREIRPDLVIAACGMNDLASCLSGGRGAIRDNDLAGAAPGFEAEYKTHVFDRIVRKKDAGPIAILNLVRRLREGPPPPPAPSGASGASHAFVVQDEAGLFYLEARRRRAAAEKIGTPPEIGDCLDAYERNLARMGGLAREYRVPLVFVTQGSLYRPDLSPEEEALLWFGSAGQSPFSETPARAYYTAGVMADLLDAYNDRMRAAAAANQVSLWDAAREIPRTAEFYYDDCHFTPAGSRRMAAGLASFMRQRLLAGPGFSFGTTPSTR